MSSLLGSDVQSSSLTPSSAQTTAPPPLQRLHSNTAIPRFPPPITSAPPLIRPWPLFILSCTDLASSLHQQSSLQRLSSTLVALAYARCLVGGGLCGLSKRWRSRGGWVGLATGISVGAVVWELCWAMMMKGERGESKSGGNAGTMGQGDQALLLSSASFAIAEYLLFLFLYRLSPPLRAHHLPFSPRSNIDIPRFPATYSHDVTTGTSLTDNAPRAGSRHMRYPSMRSARSGRSARFKVGQQTTPSEQSAVLVATESSHMDTLAPPSIDENVLEREEDEEEYDDEDGFYSSEAGDDDGLYDEPFGIDDTGLESDASSVSESSIIDLPLPTGPTRIPTTSLSIRSGLNVAADIVDETPVLGALIRRTRSARLLSAGGALGRSMDSQSELASRSRTDNDPSSGYGTFGTSPA